MAENFIKAGMGEIVKGKETDILVAYGIGSCVVVVCYDEKKPAAVMLHALLPEKVSKNEHRAKYANTGVEDAIKEIISMGSNIKDIRAKIFGGAKMFEIGSNMESIGERNVKAAKEVLERKGILVTGEDTGKNYGRTIEFKVMTRSAVVKSFGKETIII